MKTTYPQTAYPKPKWPPHAKAHGVGFYKEHRLIQIYRSAKLALLYKSMFFIEETYLAGGGSTPWNPIWTAVKRTVLKSVLTFSESSIEVFSGLPWGARNSVHSSFPSLCDFPRNHKWHFRLHWPGVVGSTSFPV